MGWVATARYGLGFMRPNNRRKKDLRKRSIRKVSPLDKGKVSGTKAYEALRLIQR